MTEKAFEIKVKRFLADSGCWFVKTWSNGIQRAGIPDLIVCCHGTFLGVELKAEHGYPSALQIWNLDEIRKAGGIGIVLYPDQFKDFQELINYLNIGWSVKSILNRFEEKGRL